VVVVAVVQQEPTEHPAKVTPADQLLAAVQTLQVAVVVHLL
jgi:hypothetical protein